MNRVHVRMLLWFSLLLTVLLIVAPSRFAAQTPESTVDLEKKAVELIKQQKYTQAAPMLERLAVAEPERADFQFYLGFALISQANSITDQAARKALRVRARNVFLRAKELGMREPVVEGLIQSLPPDGSEGKAFSGHPEANKLMNEAEGFFGQGKLEEALQAYQQALRLDPKLYEAALFSGDVYFHRGDFAQAEVWYQKAISIDPDKETAYRYSASPLMKQKKYDQARDRYIEAYISEPYSKFSVSGLTQWAQATNTSLSHPQIDVPTDVSFDDKGNAKINLDPAKMGGGKDDGAFAWVAYGATRTVWRKEKFAKTFPQEKTYRHSLAEEADALRSVLTVAAGAAKVKTLHPSLAKLKKLNDAGLLEAYIIMARPDQGIAQDQRDYLHQHRDKLRRYVVEYVLTNGGSN